MPNSWRQAYTDLTGFIAEHPEIKIEATRIRLPQDIRPEFYQLFNVVRKSFIEEKFSDLLNEATVLSQKYLAAEQEVTRLLTLDEVSMVPYLQRFLHDPMDGLIRETFELLFDLLKAKVDIESFEQKATQIIWASFKSLYWFSYEKWVALSLVKLLEADKLFQVTLRELDGKDLHMSKARELIEGVPAPVESRSLLFNYGLNAVFMVPDLIAHSTKANRYIAIRSQIDEALGIANNASIKREWLLLTPVVALEPDITLVYVADNPEEISLVADSNKICRPDLIIESRGQKDWHKKEELEKVKLCHNSLKPTLGTYIISREPVPEQVPYESAMEQKQKSSQEPESEKQEEGIHILTVGFDQTKLEPIITILMKQENQD